METLGFIPWSIRLILSLTYCMPWMTLIMLILAGRRSHPRGIGMKLSPSWHVWTIIPLVMIVPSGKRNLLMHRRQILFNWIATAFFRIYSDVPIIIAKPNRIVILFNENYSYFVWMPKVSIPFVQLLYKQSFSLDVFAVQRLSTASILYDLHISTLIIAVQSTRVNYFVLLIYLNYPIITIAK